MKFIENRFWFILSTGTEENLATINLDRFHALPSIEIAHPSRIYGREMIGIDFLDDSCKLVTDKYGMLPLFRFQYYNDIYLFTHFDDLFKHIPEIVLTPDPAGIWAAMTYDILWGQRTVSNEIKMLPVGSEITINMITGEEHVVEHYTLSFQELSGITLQESGREILKKLKTAFAENQSDQFLLPLSGGIDSRLLAGVLVEQYGPDRITTLTVASHKTSYEIQYANAVCDVLGIKKRIVHILTPDSYTRALNVFPRRTGGNLSIAHGHVYDALISNINRLQGLTLISGAFADAAGGYLAESDDLKEESVEQTFSYQHIERLNTFLKLGQIKDTIQNDIRACFKQWSTCSSIKTFDEYAYIKNRQPRILFAQSSLYRDHIPVYQPFANEDLSAFLFSLPFHHRNSKRALRSAINLIQPGLGTIPDVSSRMIQDTFSDKYRLYRSKLVNNFSLLLTALSMDRQLFFSPYFTESQDYLLRTSHRKLALQTLKKLTQSGIITGNQNQILSRKPYRLYRGLHIPCAQYWAITIAAVLGEEFYQK